MDSASLSSKTSKSGFIYLTIYLGLISIKSIDLILQHIRDSSIINKRQDLFVLIYSMLIFELFLSYPT